MPSFPLDYTERVYAGVLGKIIGVYLGRPFEGWEYERIMAELGEIDGYVHEKRGHAASPHRRRHFGRPSPLCGPWKITATRLT